MGHYKKIFIVSLVGLFSCVFAAVETLAAVAIVVNPKNPLSSIGLDDVKKIYLGKTRTFPDNHPVIPVDQGNDTAVYQEFLLKVIEKNVKEIKAYWSVKIFTGRGTPPIQISSDAEVKEWLQKNPEGIGYIDLKAVDSTVKAVAKVP